MEKCPATARRPHLLTKDMDPDQHESLISSKDPAPKYFIWIHKILGYSRDPKDIDKVNGNNRYNEAKARG